MSHWDFFSGQISVQVATKRGKPKNCLDFDVPKTCQKEDLKHVLMTNFKSWSFSDEEKKVLSHPIRKTLWQIRHLCHDSLKEQAENLCQLLQEAEGFKIKIKTHGYGGFVCLAALLGKIPKNKDICIECYSVPIALFPKKLLRRKPFTVPANVKMSFLYPDQEWLSPFKTLRKCPNALKLNSTCKVEEKHLSPRIAA